MKDLFTFATMFCLSIALAAGCQSTKGDDEGEEATHAVIQQSDLPAAVSAGFNKAHPTATVTKIEREKYKDGTVHYEFEYTEKGKKGEVELNADGEVLEDH